MNTETALNNSARTLSAVETAGPGSNSDWRFLRTMLVDRIRRRGQALSRLSPDSFRYETVAAQLESATNDPQKLWALFEQLEQRLDTAFAQKAAAPIVASRATAGIAQTHHALR